MRPILLDSDWQLRSSAEVGRGEQLSRAGLDATGWQRARLPATVVGALIEGGVYRDPFPGSRFLELPGRGPAHENFSNHPMPEDSPFRVPWWFRRELELGAIGPDEQVWLRFDGINYRGALWLNGALVAGPERIVGAYRSFDFCVTEHVHAGKNALALEVSPPAPNDLAVTWVDWNPSPPDKNMGLWRSAWLRRTGKLALFHPYVATRSSGSGAELTIHVDVENPTSSAQVAELRFELEGRRFGTHVQVPARTRSRVTVQPSDTPELRLASAKLWWPRSMGEQPLYTLDIELFVDGQASDSDSVRFGIREVTSELVEHDAALFRINGRPILIRGGGWAGDLFQRKDPERERYQYEYVKHLGLNTIRFEGMLQDREFLQRCDEDGMLVIAGFCCCDHWEKWDNWKAEDYEVSAESLRSEIRRVRHHASLISWWYGSDFPPPRSVEQRYLAVLEEELWPNPVHSSAAAKPTELTGPSGMKMAGPYDYVPPVYWHTDEQRGGAFGFATEISPGPAVPPLESLRAMLGEERLWPPNEVWTQHAGGGPFKSLEIFDTALSKRYGAPESVADYARKAQLATYEAQRAMFEAFTERKYRATGVVQWMLNNAWPSLIWHLWDWYLRPGGGYFGTKKACEPLHAQYSYAARTISVVSEHWQPFAAVEVRARVFDAHARELHHESATIDVPADGVVRALTLPSEGLPELHFLRIELWQHEKLHSTNFYWLSTRPDVVDHEKGNWYYTPLTQYADFTALQDLAPSELSVRADVVAQKEGRAHFEVELENPTPELAFFARLRLLRGDQEVLPTFWDDNFVSLLPGEKLTIGASAPVHECADGDLSVEVTGHNLPALTVTLSPSR